MREGITEEMIQKFKLGSERWTVEGRGSVVRGVSFTSEFDIDKIMQIGWFRFMGEIVSK